MRRREFMGAAAMLALGEAVGSTGAAAAPGLQPLSGGTEAVADRLIEAYASRRSLAAIGEACRRDAAAHPAACAADLRAAIGDLLRHLDLSAGEVRRMVRGAIRARIERGNRADFSAGRIVPVRGWLLAESEARLCMIAALRMA